MPSSPPYVKAKDLLLLELQRRADQRSLWSWQWRVFLGRFFSKYPDQLGHILHTRKQWPEGSPIRGILLNVPLLHPSDDVVVRARVHGTGGPWAQRCLGIWGGRLTADEFRPELGTAPPDATTAQFDFQILVGAGITPQGGIVESVDPSSAILAWAGTGLTVEIGGEVLSIMEQVLAGSTDDAIRRLRPSLVRTATGRTKLAMRSTSFHIGDGQQDWALGALCEVLRDGQVAASAPILYPLPSKGEHVNPMRAWGLFDLQWKREPPSTQDLAAARWEIRLSGKADIALNDFDRTSYWAGQFTLPIKTIESVDE